MTLLVQVYQVSSLQDMCNRLKEQPRKDPSLIGLMGYCILRNSAAQWITVFCKIFTNKVCHFHLHSIDQ